MSWHPKGDGNLTINDLAYDVNKNLGFTVYVSENGKYEPYLVLTNDYDDNVLLLRKHVLQEPFRIKKDANWHGSRGSYYPKSEVDFFLNNSFLQVFAQSVLNIISETNVVVTTEKSLEGGGGFSETEIIKRKVFVLSVTEFGIKSGMANKEGKVLKYFKDSNSFIATNDVGEPQIYWTRTPYLVDDIKTWTVSYNGSCGSCPVQLEQRVRPAFCVSRNTLVTEQQDVIEGQNVYVLG